MPLLSITTNQNPEPGKRSEIVSKASALAASLLGKPEHYVMVVLNPDAPMAFAGTDEPCAYLELKSLGLPGDKTSIFSEGLCKLIEQELGIAPGRVYIEFAGPERHMWGWNSGTF